MAWPDQPEFSNKILRLLSSIDFAAIKNELESIDLPRLFTFSKPNEVPEFCYFIETGIGSIVAQSPEGQKAEVGIVGNDGLVPASIMADVNPGPFSIFMQVAGTGYRISTQSLLRLASAQNALHLLLNRYAQALTVQIAYTALSNANHQIDERLARWILMCHDRTEGDMIALTHEFLSVMLAVRRPSVTTSLHVLEGNHFITAARGSITVRDRAGLEDFAADAYGIPEQEYERLLGTLRKRRD